MPCLKTNFSPASLTLLDAPFGIERPNCSVASSIHLTKASRANMEAVATAISDSALVRCSILMVLPRSPSDDMRTEDLAN